MPGLEEGVGGLGDLLTHDPPPTTNKKAGGDMGPEAAVGAHATLSAAAHHCRLPYPSLVDLCCGLVSRRGKWEREGALQKSWREMEHSTGLC